MKYRQVVEIGSALTKAGFQFIANAEFSQEGDVFVLTFDDWSDFYQGKNESGRMNGFLTYQGWKQTVEVRCSSKEEDPTIPVDQSQVKGRFASIFAQLDKVQEP